MIPFGKFLEFISWTTTFDLNLKYRLPVHQSIEVTNGWVWSKASLWHEHLMCCHDPEVMGANLGQGKLGDA